MNIEPSKQTQEMSEAAGTQVDCLGLLTGRAGRTRGPGGPGGPGTPGGGGDGIMSDCVYVLGRA